MSGGRKRVTPRARHVTHQDPAHLPGQNVPDGKKQGKKARKKRNARIREQLDERGHIVNAKTIRARLAAAKARRDEEAREGGQEEGET